MKTHVQRSSIVHSTSRGLGGKRVPLSKDRTHLCVFFFLLSQGTNEESFNFVHVSSYYFGHTPPSGL